MKTNWILFLGFGLLYIALAIIYWLLGGEAVGITAMGLSGGLAGLIAYYMWFVSKRTGGVLPEDSLDAEIADGAGDLGQGVDFAGQVVAAEQELVSEAGAFSHGQTPFALAMNLSMTGLVMAAVF